MMIEACKENVVTLSKFQVYLSGMVGVGRQTHCISQKTGYNGINNGKRGWQDHCDGALGEQAFAKWLNVFWDGSPNIYRKEPDVDIYEVRTNAQPWGDLILRDRDKNEGIYVLVLSHDCPQFTIRGWINGDEGKSQKWWRRGDPNRPEAYFVPQEFLHPMDTLPKLS